MADWPKEALDTIAELRREIERLKAENERLRAENRELRRRLAELERSQKRQAAPFSRGAPKANPKRAGRKPGAAHGGASHRPPPSHVDETIDVPFPKRCPHCGGPMEEDAVHDQFQTDIPPVRPRVIRFRVHVGFCRRCGRRSQGRHPQQTSDAVGAAGNQVGPRVLAVAAQLNKSYGMTYGKMATVLGDLFGLRVAPSTLVRGLERLAFRAEPAYEELRREIRKAAAVYPDETGWKVAARLAWLWVFTSPAAKTTVYAIRPSRGSDVVEELLGPDFAGNLGHDGWAPYDQVLAARHQTCLAHILRRCDHLLEFAQRGAARFPRAVKDLLGEALALRDRRDAGLLSPHGLRVAVEKLEARAARLLWGSIRYGPNRKLAKHLRAHRDQLFAFLKVPGLEATNWPAEQALRPAVVNRKVWGGNRAWIGAATQSVLASILRTCSQRNQDPHRWFTAALQAPLGHPLPPIAPARR
jgi:transposase